MADIVERLRERKATWMQAIAVMEDAATEIERLRTWKPFDDAPRDGRWILATCNDKSALFRISWGRARDGQMAWCSADRSYGDGLFLPHGIWIDCPPFWPLGSADKNGEQASAQDGEPK